MRNHENPLEGSCLLLQEEKDGKGEQDVFIDGRPVM